MAYQKHDQKVSILKRFNGLGWICDLIMKGWLWQFMENFLNLENFHLVRSHFINYGFFPILWSILNGPAVQNRSDVVLCMIIPFTLRQFIYFFFFIKQHISLNVELILFLFPDCCKKGRLLYTVIYMDIVENKMCLYMAVKIDTIQRRGWRRESSHSCWTRMPQIK